MQRPSREPYLNSYIEKLRQDIHVEMSENKYFPRNNLNKLERQALERLSKNTDITIKPADKGGVTVILNSVDYYSEAMRQLNNEDYYRRVETDKTKDHEDSISRCIETLVKNEELEEDIGELLKPRNSRTPIFYMLPRIHKVDNPGRPAVSSVRSHTEKLSAYVDEFLRPLAQKLPSHIQDTTDFILRLRGLGKLPSNCNIATLDVSSLYTNIDTEEGLKIIEEELIKTGQEKPSAG